LCGTVPGEAWCRQGHVGGRTVMPTEYDVHRTRFASQATNSSVRHRSRRGAVSVAPGVYAHHAGGRRHGIRQTRVRRRRFTAVAVFSGGELTDGQPSIRSCSLRSGRSAERTDG